MGIECSLPLPAMGKYEESHSKQTEWFPSAARRKIVKMLKAGKKSAGKLVGEIP